MIMEKRKKRNDIILASVLLTGALLLMLFFLLSSKKGEWAVVTQNGTETARYPLDRDAEIRIDAGGGAYNILVIKDGWAYVSEASCPDKLCVKQHKINGDKETIVCLPNKTVISIEAEKKSDADLVG